jgi:putative ABC transport system permease protein
LLSSAALLVQSTVELARVDPGFEPHRALTFNMGLQGEAFASGAARARLFSRVTDALTSVPGVAAVGVSHRLPLTGNSSFGFRKIGQDGPLDMLQANYRSISGRYFTSMGISLVAGRTFTDAESWEHGGVAIVNQAAVDKFWSGQSPVGQRISVGSGDRPPLEIVGVAADSRESGLTDDVEPAAYLPYVVAPVPAMAIVVRTAVDPGSLLPAVPRAVAGVDRSLAVAGIQTMDVFMASLQTQPRFNSGLASLFALLAVVLASVGVSGVAGWVVAVRSREFGIRLALGALPRQIVRRVVRDALATAALGLAIGVALSLAAGRLLTDLLFGLAPGDPLTLGAVALTLLLVAGVATLVPARRILRLDPAVTLRQ